MRELLEGYSGIKDFELKLEPHPKGYELSVNPEFIGNLAENIAHMGWAPKNAGNISYRRMVGHDLFYITASGSNFNDLQEEDLIAVNRVSVKIGNEVLEVSGQTTRGEISYIDLMGSMRRQGLLEDMFKHLGKEMPRLPLKLMAERKGYGRGVVNQRYLEKALEIVSLTMQRTGIKLTDIVKYLKEKELFRPHVEAFGTKPPSSETLMHALIYARRYGFNMIIHCHEPATVEEPDELLAKTETPNEVIGYGTMELAIEAAEQLKDKIFVILQGHGPVAAGYLEEHSEIGLDVMMVNLERASIISRYKDKLSEEEYFGYLFEIEHAFKDSK